ncbi:alpha-acetolactate decarboxylase, putative [Babesia ovis]|uniref:Alpha-acetolactate decarboxylase, putative n=1 Tax=Babesia ovis TaxID=5869 RepID=A0A9W5WW88_BABOV|nr:alpha-acetolactate decarboxylase, putative [Babesia ovis]
MKKVVLLTDMLNANHVIPEEDHVNLEESQDSYQEESIDNEDEDEGSDDLGDDRYEDGTPSSAGYNESINDALPDRLNSEKRSSSFRSSFSSTINSFIGYCNLTRNRFKYRFSRSLGVADSSSNLDLSESQYILGAQRFGTQGSKDFEGDSESREKRVLSSVVDAKTSTGTGAQTKLAGLQLPRPTTWTTWKRPDGPKTVKSKAIGRSGVSIKERLTRKAKGSGTKPAVDHDKLTEHRKHSHEQTAICYVLASNKSPISTRIGKGNKNTISFSFKKNGKLLAMRSRCKSTCGNSGSIISSHQGDKSSGDGKTMANLQHDKQQPAADNKDPGCMKCGNVMFASDRFRFPWNRYKRNDGYLNNMFNVTIVNRGSANIYIMKYQSTCKNYMDISPDFGWRRMVEEYSNWGNGNSGTKTRTATCSDETYALRSYMYYRESKKLTHVIGLCELALNIACRALILGVTHGIIDTECVPGFINDIVAKNCGEQYVPQKKRQESMETTVTESEPEQHAMYLKGSLIGLFVPSSIHAILGSKAYKEHMRESKRKYRWKMLGDEQHKESGADSAEPDIYNFLSITNYGWKLIQRSYFDRTFLENNTKTYGKGIIAEKFRQLFARSVNDTFTTTSIYSNAVLCKIKPPQIKNQRAYIYSDVGSVGMNIAEQLYRLEHRQLAREKLPKNTFGFKVKSPNVAVSPCGVKFTIVPEELILNVATMVHEMYITQACLML